MTVAICKTHIENLFTIYNDEVTDQQSNKTYQILNKYTKPSLFWNLLALTLLKVFYIVI